MGKTCIKCGATLTQNCPVEEDEFCEKRKVLVCPSCDFVEMEEDYPAGCNHPEKGQEK